MTKPKWPRLEVYRGTYLLFLYAILPLIGSQHRRFALPFDVIPPQRDGGNSRTNEEATESYPCCRAGGPALCAEKCYRDRFHFSAEANHAFDSYFCVFRSCENLLLSLPRRIHVRGADISVRSERIEGIQKTIITLEANEHAHASMIPGRHTGHRIELQVQADLWVCHRSYFSRIIPVFKFSELTRSKTPLTVGDVLFANRALRNAFDQLVEHLDRRLATIGEHTQQERSQPFNQTVRSPVRAQELIALLSESSIRSHDEMRPNAPDSAMHGGNHYCKTLCYFTIKNKVFDRVIRWDDNDYRLADVVRIAARLKEYPFNEDDVLEPVGEMIGLPETDRLYQQWASTRYASNPMGTFIVSLSHQVASRIPINTERKFMPTWVERRYLPIMILVHFQQHVLHMLSAEDQRKSRRPFRKHLLIFRRELWLSTVANDIQDERIWEEAKKANRLDELFTALNDQVRDEAQERLNRLIMWLTVVEIVVGLLSVATTILTSSAFHATFHVIWSAVRVLMASLVAASALGISWMVSASRREPKR